jgi:hypothetical protein
MGLVLTHAYRSPAYEEPSVAHVVFLCERDQFIIQATARKPSLSSAIGAQGNAPRGAASASLMPNVSRVTRRRAPKAWKNARLLPDRLRDCFRFGLPVFGREALQRWMTSALTTALPDFAEHRLHVWKGKTDTTIPPLFDCCRSPRTGMSCSPLQFSERCSFLRKSALRGYHPALEYVGLRRRIRHCDSRLRAGLLCGREAPSNGWCLLITC